MHTYRRIGKLHAYVTLYCIQPKLLAITRAAKRGRPQHGARREPAARPKWRPEPFLLCALWLLPCSPSLRGLHFPALPAGPTGGGRCGGRCLVRGCGDEGRRAPRCPPRLRGRLPAGPAPPSAASGRAPSGSSERFCCHTP